MLCSTFPALLHFSPASGLGVVHSAAVRAGTPQMMFVGPTLGLAAAALAATSVKIVGTADVQLIERLGKYNRQLNPGLHFVIPLVERTSFACTAREQVLDIPPQKAITRDNAPLTADAVVYWKVTDPELARYAVQDLVPAIQNLVLTQLRSEIGKLTLDETFSARQQMNAILLQDLDAATDDWGVKVTRVEVRDIIPSPDIMQAMELQMSAERKKRADILQSEGRRASQVNDASGAADAKVLAADAEAKRLIAESEGEARSLEKIAEATVGATPARVAAAVRRAGILAPSRLTRVHLPRVRSAAQGGDLDKAMQILLLSKYWRTQAALAQSNNAKVLFFPSKATVPLTYEGLREIVTSE